MAAIYQPLSAVHFTVPRGQLLFAREGTTALKNVGSCTVEQTDETESSEVKTNEEPGRPIVFSDVVEANSTIKITLNQLAPFMLAAGLMAPEGETHTQAAVAAVEQEVSGVQNGDIIELVDATGVRVFDTTVASVEVGGVALPASAYLVDKSAGRVQILSGAAAPAEVTITFSGAAITATGGWDLFRARQNLNVRGKVVIRQNNARGLNREFWIPRGSLRKTGGTNWISDSNDPASVEFELRVERDDTQPIDRQYGYVITYPNG